ncbi:MICOS complex subunit MIC27 isoform X2 [Parambassis ranga]|uniref:MICOS complex subunit n=1 Tax=Parambassis ranga TaxID=210632 RepID=A0A6P7J6R1_9TELE|nr:flocculation protein FLO11-like isoform X2 [Parambassis ranga]
MAAKVVMVAVPAVLGIASIRVYTVNEAPTDGVAIRERLNIYTPLHSSKVKFVAESPGVIERGLTTARETVLPLVYAVKGACVSVKRGSVNLYHAGEDVYYYLKDPPLGFLPRLGTITMAGLLGMFLARKGSRFKRLAVPLGLMSAGASVCYPAQAVAVLKVTGRKVYAAGQWSSAAVSSLLTSKEPVAKEIVASQPQSATVPNSEAAAAPEPSSPTATAAQSSTISETEVESAESVPVSDEPIVAVITDEKSSVTLTDISPEQAPTETSSDTFANSVPVVTTAPSEELPAPVESDDGKQAGLSAEATASSETIEADPVESVVPETAPVESVVPETAPVDSVTAETAPVESVIAETAPVESVTAETAPVESVTAETAPVESVVPETAPVESVPVDAAQVESVVPETAPVVSVVPETAPVESVVHETAPVESVTAETAPVESVTAETAPVESVTAETALVESAPVESVTAETAQVESVTAETAPVESAPVESVTAETAQVESVTAATAPLESVTAATAPVESVTAETAPVESAPAETAPVESAPADTAPDDSVPAETATVDTAPVESVSAESMPVESDPVKPDPVEPAEEAPVGESAELSDLRKDLEETSLPTTTTAPPLEHTATKEGSGFKPDASLMDFGQSNPEDEDLYSTRS